MLKIIDLLECHKNSVNSRFKIYSHALRNGSYFLQTVNILFLRLMDGFVKKHFNSSMQHLLKLWNGSSKDITNYQLLPNLSSVSTSINTYVINSHYLITRKYYLILNFNIKMFIELELVMFCTLVACHKSY